jgi:pSer/pThr/pTyr-binding forkhead associated (FHA) protein
LRPATEIGEALLVAVTPEAEQALGGAPDLRLTHFPFKFGRESRVSQGAFAREQRLGRILQVNDVYLKEPASGLSQISRDHFAIERMEDQFFVVDRGSVTGTIVAERRIGGHRKGGRTALRIGDEIRVVDERSPYIFRFTMKPEA